MAQSIVLTSGSVLNGNPITIAVTPSPAPVSDASASGISMHRIIIEVECGMSGGSYEVIKLSSPVITEGKAQTIDISSALRTFRDSYEYTPNPTTYPLVKFNVKAYDEYMLDGEVKKADEVWYPLNPSSLPDSRRDEAYLRTIFGAFSDMVRLTSPTGFKGVQTLSLKPKTAPQLVAVGEPLAYTPAYSEEQHLIVRSGLEAPESKVAEVKKEGAQTLGYQSVYALPASEAKNRQVFRFINSFGVLESISIPKASQKKIAITSNQYVVARQETFNSFSHGIVRKQNNRESWSFATDPLDEAWLSWYLHEFLMSEHVWMQAPVPDASASGTLWLPVTIAPEETTFLDRTKNDAYQVAFTAQLDINGSPLL